MRRSIGLRPTIEAEMTSSLERVAQITPPPTSGRQELAMRTIVRAAVVIAIVMRVYGLDGHFDYDGYDEGVYWQTLRAMSAGYRLYGEIFCSQPPAFLLSIYPLYLLFGSTISAARLGVAALSLLGLGGAYLMGKALAGRAGGIAALVIVVATPSYLEASQRLQAEGPATAFLFLTAGAALVWRKHPTGRKGLVLAALCGVALLLGTLSKLLDVTAIVPVLVLALARLWQIRREAGSRIGTVLRPIAGATMATIVVSLIVSVPFLSSFPAVVQQVLTFHIAARNAMTVSEPGNTYLLYRFLAANAVLSAGAATGIIVATLRHDWRIVPLTAWLLVTLIVLNYPSSALLASRHRAHPATGRAECIGVERSALNATNAAGRAHSAAKRCSPGGFFAPFCSHSYWRSILLYILSYLQYASRKQRHSTHTADRQRPATGDDTRSVGYYRCAVHSGIGKSRHATLVGGYFLGTHQKLLSDHAGADRSRIRSAGSRRAIRD